MKTGNSSPGGTPTRQPHAEPTMMPHYSSSNVVKTVYKRTSTAPSNFATATEIDTLAAIKTLTVRAENAKKQSMLRQQSRL